MDTIKIENLRMLLENAMPHLEVFMGAGSNAYPIPPMYGAIDSKDISVYREDLKLSRRFATMRINPFFDRSYLKITDAVAHDRLMDAIMGDLEPFFLGDERRQTAWAMKGQIHGGFSVEDSVQSLLEHGILHGTKSAAHQFYKELAEDTFCYQEYALVEGLRIGQEIEIGNGIRLIPLSDYSNALPSFLPERPGDFDRKFFMSKTVLVRECSHSPKWVVPAQMPAPDSGDNSWLEWFTTTEPSLNGVKFDVDGFCDALTLVVDHPIRTVARWHHSDPDQIFGFHSKSSKSGMMFFLNILVSRGAPQPVDQSHIEPALKLYRARQTLAPRDADRLRVAIERLIKESIYSDVVDAVIDLGIALESIYMPEGIRDELTFRLSLHAGLFLETEPEKRQAVMDRMRAFYSRRSTAVHTGVLKDSNGINAPRTLRTEAHAICRRSIMKILEEGGFPDWNKLVAGT